MTYTTTAEDIVNAVIQDGQVQTTNRTALLDYVGRVSNRILRESKWLFLRSPEYRFITQPDVQQYWLGTGSAPAGVVSTGLNLGDIYGVLGDSVFDLTNMRILQQDASRTLVNFALRYKDGQFHSQVPRSYVYDPNDPNVLNIYPPPDANNTYQPIANSPVCGLTTGTNYAPRNYYVVVTLVDSNGGESVPCTLYNNTIVPVGSLLTVQSPTMEVSSASLVNYPYYNVYIATGSSTANYYRQNTYPIPQGTVWTQSTIASLGMMPPTSVPVADGSSNLYSVGIVAGQLEATSQNVPGEAVPIYLEDGNGDTWLLGINGSGQLTTIQEPGPATNLILYDGTAYNWQVSVQTNGQLTTHNIGIVAPVFIQPPTTSTVQPLNGYVISFQYQKVKVPITTTTQVLQIPDQYYDVVVAGVNYYANMYTAKADDINMKVNFWKREFMEGLQQIRRDLRVNFKNSDIIYPDPCTQYSPTAQYGYAFYIV